MHNVNLIISSSFRRDVSSTNHSSNSDAVAEGTVIPH
jgi:hypothetical protein